MHEAEGHFHGQASIAFVVVGESIEEAQATESS